jgi:hypothetical protein
MMLVTWTTTRRDANVAAASPHGFIATMGGAGAGKRATIKRLM